MLLNPKIQKAIYIATHQHREQKRKISDLPYIAHPFSVAWLLSEHVEDEDLIAAAFLHDVLEDTEGYLYEDIVRDFGERVADYVKNVTEEITLSWHERKEKYIQNLYNVSEEVLMLVAADKIHNLSAIREEIAETGILPWGTHFKSMEETKWFYTSVFEALERRMKHKVFLEELKQELDAVFR